jgi:hypothetical protein
VIRVCRFYSNCVADAGLVALLAKCALRVRHPGHTAIQTVEHHGAKNANRRFMKAPIHRHHDAIKTAKQGRQGKKLGRM